MHTKALVKCALLAACFASAGPAHAQSKDPWPARPVRIVVPQAPGASTDLTARLIAQKLSPALGQPVIVENRPGAGSIVGTELVAKATPDGHTLLVVASSIMLTPILNKNLPYDLNRDLVPITQLSSFPNILVVHPAVPAKTVQELISLLKSKPGALNYGSAGTATGTHLSAELFKSMTGTDMVHVPYKGGGAAVPALLGGQVQLMFASIVSALPQVRAGKLRALGVTSPRRSPSAPDVPTIAEAGVPGYDHTPWNGFFAPAKTPRNIVVRLNGEVAKILHTPDVKTVFTNDGAEPVGNKPEEFAAIMKSETAKWTKVIKAAGIKAD
ncbi:MAG: Bug family tripartite tricarboxylate transporter substrate binding protein [Burkholderiales bacterium]